MISKEISSKVKTLNLIMTIGMIFYHCGDPGFLKPVNELDLALNNFINESTQKIGLMVMSFFFLISGFFTYSNIQGKLSMKEYCSKIKRRVFSCLVPYIIWNILFIFLPFQKEITFFEFIESTFLFKQFPMDEPSWYLYSIFFCALISPIFWIAFNNKYGGGVLLFFCLINKVFMNSSNEMIYNITHYGYIYNTLFFFPAYMVGLYWGVKYSQKKMKGLFFELCNILLVSLFYDYKLFEEMGIVILLIVFIYFMPKINNNKNRLGRIANISFLLYTMHMYIIGKIQRPVRVHLLLKIIPYAWTANIVARFIIIPIVIVVAYLTWVVISLVSPKVIRILTGGRCIPYER